MGLVMTGYTFSGSRETVEAVAADFEGDYLLFGVWLDEVHRRAPIPSGPSQRVDSRVHLGQRASSRR